MSSERISNSKDSQDGVSSQQEVRTESLGSMTAKRLNPWEAARRLFRFSSSPFDFSRQTVEKQFRKHYSRKFHGGHLKSVAIFGMMCFGVLSIWQFSVLAPQLLSTPENLTNSVSQLQLAEPSKWAGALLNAIITMSSAGCFLLANLPQTTSWRSLSSVFQVALALRMAWSDVGQMVFALAFLFNTTFVMQADPRWSRCNQSIVLMTAARWLPIGFNSSFKSIAPFVMVYLVPSLIISWAHYGRVRRRWLSDHHNGTLNIVVKHASFAKTVHGLHKRINADSYWSEKEFVASRNDLESTALEFESQVQNVAMTPQEAVNLNELSRTAHILGKGTSGTVFLGVNKQTGDRVAWKTSTLSDDNRMAERSILHEINMLRVLQHPNIVGFLGASVDADSLFLLTEYASAGNLQHIVAKHGALSECDNKTCIRHMLEGISYIHELGVMHRDIKPENVLVSHRVAKLADFGMSAFVSDESSRVRGTTVFMAPEVFEGLAGRKSDIWSLGVTAHFLNTLHYLTQEVDLHRVKSEIEDWGEVPPLFPGLNEDMQEFLRACLAKDPGQRPTARELLEHPFLQAGEELLGADRFTDSQNEVWLVASNWGDFPSTSEISISGLSALWEQLEGRFVQPQLEVEFKQRWTESRMSIIAILQIVVVILRFFWLCLNLFFGQLQLLSANVAFQFIKMIMVICFLMLPFGNDLRRRCFSWFNRVVLVIETFRQVSETSVFTLCMLVFVNTIQFQINMNLTDILVLHGFFTIFRLSHFAFSLLLLLERRWHQGQPWEEDLSKDWDRECSMLLMTAALFLALVSAFGEMLRSERRNWLKAYHAKVFRDTVGPASS